MHIPLHKHELHQVDPLTVYKANEGHWKCDKCNRESNATSYPFHCSSCSFDLCYSCVRSYMCTNINKNTLAHQHQLCNLETSSRLLDQNQNGVWICAVCKVTSDVLRETFSYHCASCADFDICCSCFEPRQHSIHPHVLNLVDRSLVYRQPGVSWECYVCGHQSRPYERFFRHCAECYFDVCLDCFKPQTSPFHDHPLYKANSHDVYAQFNGGWRCDHCASVHNNPRDHYLWHCKACEYDLCQNCMGGIIEAVPLEINLRGPLALEAYNKALSEGKACVKRVPVMLIGQDRSGKTSLKKSLMGKPFNPHEDSTVGIDVDPSHFKVSREIWKAGESTENDQATNDVKAISFEHHAARLVTEDLNEEKRGTKSMRSENIEFHLSSFNSIESSLAVSGSSSTDNAAELPMEITKITPSSETARDATESIHTSKDPKVDVRKRLPETFPNRIQRRKEHSPISTKIPDEVAVLIKKLQEVEKVQDEEDIYSVLWDFGGQSVYYTTHPLFITTRAMYLLVYDLSRDPHALAEPVVKQGKNQEILDNHGAKSNLDYLKFWMTSIASLASQDEDQHVSSGRGQVNTPPVFLVCTHADKPYGGANPVALARKVFAFLQTKPYRNQLYNDVFVVDNTKSGTESECSEVIRLRENVLAVAKELPQMKEPIPIRWLKYEKVLQVTLKEGHKWISFEMAKQIASKVCQIDDDKELLTLLDFLHDQRILIHFDDTTVLNNLVVLDPQWLVDVFKKVITVKPCHQQKKEFEELWWRLECKGILEQKLLEHVWGPLFDQQETSASLIEIMEKFSLICPWPSSDASCGKQYLVPSMLMSHPPKDIIDLVASARIPSLFLKFESGQVPPGLFPRLVLQFFRWGQNQFWSAENPQLYHSFARFYTSKDEDCSVILLCHSSSIEVVVHKGNLSADLAESLQSKLNISANTHDDEFEVFCARAVRRQLGLMLEGMRKEFCWLKNMKYEERFICLVCCQGHAVKYCTTHHKQGCEQEECLHFWTESDLRSDKQFIRCRKYATARSDKVHVKQFAPWISETSDEQLTIVERDGRLLTPEEVTPAQGLKRKQEPPSSSAIAKRRKLATTGKDNKVIVVKKGSPSFHELEKLSPILGIYWESLARRLGFHEGEITGFRKDNDEYAKKAQGMLFEWKERHGRDATYKALYQALCDPPCQRKRIAEEFCCILN